MEENKEKLILNNNVKSNLILKKIFGYLSKVKSLEIIRYNNNIKKKLNINLDNYKDITNIEIELEISSNKNLEIKYISLYSYVNDIYDYYIYREKKDQTIIIIIKHNLLSLCGLFKECEDIINIKFIKFNRTNIDDMSYMFYKCSSLKNLDVSKFCCKNVKNMRNMFFGCSSLTNLDLSQFDTKNVKDMSYMFYGCESLKELNLSNFNTENVNHMNSMFYKCSSLKNLDLSNFNTDNVIYMPDMFAECTSLTELNISNFNFSNIKYIEGMFSSCSDDLKEKVKGQNKNIKNEAFN